MTKIWKGVVISVFFVTCFFLILGNLKRIISTTGPDFTVLWTSAGDMLADKNPYLNPEIYTPNAYPPVSEIFYLPLRFFSYPQALGIFTLISFASIIGSVFLGLKLVTKKVPWQYFLLFMGLAFMSFPTKYSLGMGQVNPIVLFLLLLAFFLESKKQSVKAGVLMGVAISLKPIFAFFLLLFLLRKSWKMVVTTVAFVSILIISSLVFWPIDIWFSWWQTGITPLSNFAGREAYVNQGFVAFVSRFIENIDQRIYVNLTATIALIALAVYMTVRKTEQNLLLSLYILILLLLDTTSWQHHFVWLIFPFITLFIAALKAKNTVILVLLAISYILASWNFKSTQGIPLIFLSHQFYATLILLGITIYLK